MSVRCLGKPTIPKDIVVKLAIPKRTYQESGEEQNFKEKTEVNIRPKKYLELSGKQYLPVKGRGEIDQSENSSVNAIRRSKKEPQPLCEIKNIGGGEKVKDSTLFRLWLYDGKIYEADRNDYDKEQVKYLILDFLDKEKEEFQKLKQKYELKKEDSG